MDGADGESAKRIPRSGRPNVILSQHTSGSSSYNADRITSIFMDNLGRYLRGEPMMNEVNVDLGY